MYSLLCANVMLAAEVLSCSLSVLFTQALHVLHVALDKLGLVGATRVDPQVPFGRRVA